MKETKKDKKQDKKPANKDFFKDSEDAKVLRIIKEKGKIGGVRIG